MKYVPSKDELQRAYEFMKGKGIPKMPEVILELQKEITQYEPNLQKVGTIIEKDMALSGLVLRTVNSGSYGLQRKVESIRHAAMLLGLNILKDAVLISALKGALGEQSHFQELVWRVSQSNAMGAKALALDMEGMSVDSAYRMRNKQRQHQSRPGSLHILPKRPKPTRPSTKPLTLLFYSMILLISLKDYIRISSQTKMLQKS